MDPAEAGRQADDPWRVALERHFAPPGEPPPPAASGARQVALTRSRLAAAALVLLGLLTAVGVLGYLAVDGRSAAAENARRAEGWRDRSVRLQDLVADRTRALNRQTARLNLAANRFRSARAALRRSEADVAQLEDRQRELAAEKAAVEDERGALALEREALRGVAARLVGCNSALFDLYADATAGLPADAAFARARQECEGAGAAVSDYEDRFAP